jgi:hypothetical protein
MGLAIKTQALWGGLVDDASAATMSLQHNARLSA